MRVLVAKAYENAKEVLGANRALLDELTEVRVRVRVKVRVRVRVSVTVTVNTNPNPGQALIEKETVDFRELYKMVEKSHPELARAQMDKQMSMNS